jgi:predicted nuclease of predicted toxin-antitoxin system
MKLLIDMNLSPDWIDVLKQAGHQPEHWSTVGDPGATDKAIFDWARVHGYVVFTHDLDFGALLAATRALGPSVVQVRAQDILPNALGPRLVNVLRQFQAELEHGALITVDDAKSRVRILPISRRAPG